MEKTIPDDITLREIRECTEANHHLMAYALVSKWCAENCIVSPISDPWNMDKKRFLYFEEYFNRLLAHVRDVGIVPFWKISFEMQKELLKQIVRSFGKETEKIFCRSL